MWKIKQCSTVQHLQQLVDHQGPNLDYIKISAAISMLPKLHSTAAALRQQQGQQQRDRLRLLDQLWQLLQPKLLEYDHRGLANIIAASSKLQSENVHLYEACMQQFLQGVDGAAPRHLSNVVYALCTAPAAIRQQHQKTVQLQLIPAFIKRLIAANAQDISNVLYGVAASGQQLEVGQVQQQVKAFASIPDLQRHAAPQAIANTLWAVATMRQQVPAAQLQQMLTAFVGMMYQAKPQDVSNTLWAVATMGQKVPEDQLKQLLTAFVGMLHQAKPQAMSNTLWAMATMGQKVPEDQLKQLLTALVGILHKSNPQDVSNTLWAVATMGQQLPKEFCNGQLQQLLDSFSNMLDQATPQNITNSLWACAKWGWLPQQLLAAPQVTAKLPLTTAQQLGNVAWACGELGHADEQLLGALLEEAVQRLAGYGSSQRLDAQSVCNICWSVAVLNLQQYAPKLLPLVQACSQQLWDGVVPENLLQLQQVHTWLLDFGLAGGDGLQDILTAEQLQQCRTAWGAFMDEAAHIAASRYQRAVFAALQQLPIAWQQPPQMEQVSLGSDGQPDGALLVDIVGRTASGQLVAVEADGPFHFKRPDGGLKGSTLYRNRALKLRGYTVVIVPYYEWDKLWGSEERQRQYMQRRLAAAGIV